MPVGPHVGHARLCICGTRRNKDPRASTVTECERCRGNLPSLIGDRPLPSYSMGVRRTLLLGRPAYGNGSRQSVPGGQHPALPVRPMTRPPRAHRGRRALAAALLAAALTAPPPAPAADTAAPAAETTAPAAETTAPPEAPWGLDEVVVTARKLPEPVE